MQIQPIAPAASAPPASAPRQPQGQTLTLPQTAAAACHRNPLALAVYALIIRLYATGWRAIPLSAEDLTAYDPDLSYGQARRALSSLVTQGLLLETRQKGRKNRYTPTWGIIDGDPRPLDRTRPHWNRPRHLITITCEMALFDVLLGRIQPDAQAPAAVTRYVRTPVLGLAGIGGYLQRRCGRRRPAATHATLEAWNDVLDTDAPLPDRIALLALVAERLGPDQLSAQGRQALGLPPLRSDHPSDQRSDQPVPPVIGESVDTVIGKLIGCSPASEPPDRALPSDESPIARAEVTITWSDRMIENQESTPNLDPAGGGCPVTSRMDSEPDASPRPEPVEAATPQSESVRLLHDLAIQPRVIAELGDLTPELIDAAQQQAQRAPHIRDRAGYVVALLRAARDGRWQPATTPAITPATTPTTPALAAYQATFQRLPDTDGQAAICETVDDMDRWRATLRHWKLNDYDPRRIGKLLDCYLRGTSAPPPRAAQAEPTHQPSPFTLDDMLEISAINRDPSIDDVEKNRRRREVERRAWARQQPARPLMKEESHD